MRGGAESVSDIAQGASPAGGVGLSIRPVQTAGAVRGTMQCSQHLLIVAQAGLDQDTIGTVEESRLLCQLLYLVPQRQAGRGMCL